MDDWDDYWDDYWDCYECSANGDDYFINDKGELECFCDKCLSSISYADWDD